MFILAYFSQTPSWSVLFGFCMFFGVSFGPFLVRKKNGYPAGSWLRLALEAWWRILDSALALGIRNAIEIKINRSIGLGNIQIFTSCAFHI